MRINIGNITLILRDSSRPHIRFITKSGWYDKDFKEFKKQLGNNSGFPLYKNYPCLNDRNESAGKLGSPYFLQDLYVARKIYNNNPLKHVDIGSRIDGFVAHVAVFREIEVFDIRPAKSSIQNIIFKQADFTNPTELPVDYCDSISCLHALEHFGLGRYGDPVDAEGHEKGFNNISKILKQGGTFYFSVPMGAQRIEFNAHRIFGMPYLMQLVTKDYNISSFAYIDDRNILHENIIPSTEDIENSFGCNLGCAIFELQKR